MKKFILLFFLMPFVLSAAVYHVPADLRLRAFPGAPEPTPEEQARLTQYFDSVYHDGNLHDAHQVCYEYNTAVAPNHKGTYWIVYKDDDGKDKSFKCHKVSAADRIPIVSQLWAMLKAFFWFLLASLLPIIATVRKWPKTVRIIIYVVFAVPVILTGFAFVVAALISVWAILCAILAVVASIFAIFAAVGVAGKSFERADIESSVDNYARTHNGMYEHGSREASIHYEAEKRSKETMKE